MRNFYKNIVLKMFKKILMILKKLLYDYKICWLLYYEYLMLYFIVVVYLIERILICLVDSKVV